MSYRLLMIALSTLGLLGCAQSAYDWSANMLPPPNLLSLASQDQLASAHRLRLIIQFQQAVALDDPNVLKALQAHTQGVLQFLSAVSADTLVYSLALPAGQDVASTLQRLSAAPGVKRVELDPSVKAH